LSFTVEEFVRMSRFPWRDAFSGWTREDERAVSEALYVAGAEAFAPRPTGASGGGAVPSRAEIGRGSTGSPDTGDDTQTTFIFSYTLNFV